MQLCWPVRSAQCQWRVAWGWALAPSATTERKAGRAEWSNTSKAILMSLEEDEEPDGNEEQVPTTTNPWTVANASPARTTPRLELYTTVKLYTLKPTAPHIASPCHYHSAANCGSTCARRIRRILPIAAEDFLWLLAQRLKLMRPPLNLAPPTRPHSRSHGRRPHHSEKKYASHWPSCRGRRLQPRLQFVWRR